MKTKACTANGEFKPTWGVQGIISPSDIIYGDILYQST